MSTSPCCAEYKFPASSPSCQNEGFDFVTPLAQSGFAASKPAKEGDDYFALKPPSLTSHRPTFVSPKKPTPRNSYGSGSISSLGSEATFTEHSSFTSQDLNMSTDTLFEDCEIEADSSHMPSAQFSGVSAIPVAVSPQLSKSQRNVLQLSLSMPKKGLHHKSRSSLGYTTGSLPRQEGIKEGENESLGVSLVSSATEPRFQLDRKYSLGVAEQVLSREQGEVLTSVPTLKKQLTLPNLAPKEGSVLDTIKAQQMKRLSFVPTQENMRDSIVKLSPTISYLSPEQIVNAVRQSSVHAETGLKDLLVLDIRPLADHVKSHIAGSINICLPSTLLKRPSFDLKRCVNSLPAYEKVILQNYFHHNNLNFEQHKVCASPSLGAHGLPAILLYDHSNVSSSIYHMCRKLIDHSCFDASSAPPIYLMNGSFQNLVDAHTNVLASGKTEDIDVGTLSLQNPLEETLSSVTDLKVTSSPRSKPFGTLHSGQSTPNVSNFCLPINLPETRFKIRHNEEVFNFSTAPSHEDHISNFSVSSPGLKLLPQWLKDSVTSNVRIRADFNKLEECEKIRLNSALKIQLEQEFSTPGGRMETTPVINSGLDFGHKNRYKDIFLYEHSRVSLNDSCTEQKTSVDQKQSDCDYINASYLDSARTALDNIVGKGTLDENFSKFNNYIATQGPLPKTAGDFWKCVAYQRSSVIISLTNDFENGVEKCYAFWKSGHYLSGTNVVNVELTDTESYGNLVLRTFAITVDEKVRHKVMQLHLDSWMDMGVAVDSGDVLAMVHLKNHILSNTSNLSRYPTVIHCSAGCGRTGVFATVDILSNIFKHRGEDFEVDNDPVYDIVNDLRRQRISMVQTIRQYSSIYTLLIDGIIGAKAWQSISDTTITKAFLEI